MKQWVIAGALAGSLALAGSAQAQQAAQAGTQPAAKPSTTTQSGQAGDQAAKPAKKSTAKKTSQAAAGAETRTPKQQPNTTQDPTVSDQAMALGTVHIPQAVKADNKPLAAGTYQVRLTTDEAKPDATGTSGKLERWVEFVKNGKVAGREVVTIVPQNEVSMVQKDTPPGKGASKVETLKGGEYMRVWINKGGNYYLIHLVKG